MPDFIKISRTFAQIWRFNGFQNGGRLPSLIFEIEMFNGRKLKRPILQHRTKFREDRSNRCGGIAIFVILKIWPRPVLHVQKFESLTAVCGQNASSC